MSITTGDVNLEKREDRDKKKGCVNSTLSLVHFSLTLSDYSNFLVESTMVQKATKRRESRPLETKKSRAKRYQSDCCSSSVFEQKLNAGVEPAAPSGPSVQK